MNLNPPLDSIVIENKRGEHKNFGLPPDSTYPLRGVTYPVDYGYLPGYMGEDKAELDFFVGECADGLLGFIIVNRGTGNPNEHKFFIGITPDELEAIKKAFSSVLEGSYEFRSSEELIKAIERFRSSEPKPPA